MGGVNFIPDLGGSSKDQREKEREIRCVCVFARIGKKNNVLWEFKYPWRFSSSKKSKTLALGVVVAIFPRLCEMVHTPLLVRSTIQ